MVGSKCMDSDTGFLLINKPPGMTSHDVVDVLRRVTGIRKIGHAGTLDPFATGLLLVAVGRGATKRISQFVGLDKTYEAEFVIGATTETLDPESEVQIDERLKDDHSLVINPTCVVNEFHGPMKQVPPMYSAIKIKGKKLYNLAREGKTVEREPRDITVHSFKMLKEPWTEDGLMILSVQTEVSSGTYIRVMAQDLAAQLKTLGYVRTLNRSTIGPFLLKDATDLKDVTPENWPSLLKNLEVEAID